MRWGGIVHFISETVLTGFKIGAGIVIAVSQLPLLLGLAPQHGDLLRTLTHLVAQPPRHARPDARRGTGRVRGAAGWARAAPALADPADRRRARRSR